MERDIIMKHTHTPHTYPTHPHTHTQDKLTTIIIIMISNKKIHK